MDNIRQYLLSVISAGLVSAIVVKITGGKGLLSATIKLLAGLLMSITVISPILQLEIGSFLGYIEDMELDAQNIVEEGIQIAQAEKSAIIIQKSETYILDKAASLGVCLDAEITISNSDEQRPYSIIVTGDISPYAKQQLQNIIAEDLGIPEERQSWN